MDTDLILPAMAATSVVLVIIHKLYFKLRPKFPITVNCWFCNFNTKVPYNSSNAWYCPQCDQYNGFSPDGSYNRLLTEQFNEKVNCNFWCKRTTKKTTVDAPSNGLCRFCNINLELKVRQLAQFVPFNKDNYDEEVQLYSEQLERVYRLCLRCQDVLEKTLNKKYDTYVRNQTLTTTLDPSTPQYLQQTVKQHKSVYVALTALLSAGLLLSVMPYHWTDHLLATYPPPDYIIQVLYPVKDYLPEGFQSTVVLCLAVVVQLLDYAHMRDTSSFVNLVIWIVLLSLTQVTVHIEGLLSVVYMLAGIVFFVSSVSQHKNSKPKSIAAVKPVQLTKLGGIPESKGNTKLHPIDPIYKPVSPKCPVSDSNLAQTVPSPSREPTPEDFGLAKLNVSSMRVTRSQSRHFQTKMYGSQPQTDIFRPKSVNLTPPKLQIDKTSEYQVPLTRSSSQSSGFVSLSHQKDFEESRSPSVLGDNIDSISQCGGGAITTYQPPFVTPTSFSSPYGMPFTNFPPYTIMSFSPPQFDRFYQYSLSPYEPSLNLSSQSMHSTFQRGGWFQYVKNVLLTFLFLFLVTTHVAVLWKLYGEEYFKFRAGS